MKRILIFSAVVFLGVFVTFVLADISKSDHNFSGDSWSGTRICAPCHTPHNADKSVTAAPLWNHEVTTATYTLYSSSTFDASGSIGQPSGVSKLCLSCHDGTVAIDSFGGKTGTNKVTGDELIGTNLSNDHPVSFTYNATLATADGELYDPTTKSSGIVGGDTIDDDMLFNNKLECASCHDVHDDTYSPFLIKDNKNSDLCLTCHKK